MDVVLGIVSERDVFTRDMGKVCVIVACPTRSTFHILYHKFAVSRRYSQDPTEIQYNYSHCCTCIIMRIPPTTFMQLLRSLEIPMAQVIVRLSPDPFPSLEGVVRLRQTSFLPPQIHATV